MKKVSVLFLSFLIVLLLSACGTNSNISMDNSSSDLEISENNYNTSTPSSYESKEECNHNWQPATCTAPKSCSICGKINGSANGHNWSAATCQTPKKCKNCGITEGSTGSCIDNGNGKCTYCGEDLFLKKVRDNLTVQLIIPSVGASDNYYFQVKYVNHIGSTIYISNYVTGNGNLCNNFQGNDYNLENDYKITIPYYRGLTEYDKYDKKYKVMYLDNQSLAYRLFIKHLPKIYGLSQQTV